MTKKEAFILFGVAVALLILAIPFDLTFSSLVYDQSNLIGRVGEAIGEFPATVVAMFSSAALIFTRNTKKPLSNFGSLILGGLFLGLSALMGGILPFHYLEISLIPGFVLAVVYIVLAILVVKRIPNSQYPALRKVAWVGLLTFIVAMIAVNMIKMGWGRMRFRAMEESTAGFTPWYLPQGSASGEEFKSFPSGHVANSALILWILLIPTFYPLWDKYKSVLKIVAYAWIVFVALSRIIMGAHFISDVTVGFAVTAVILWGLIMAFKVETSVSKNR